MIIVTFYRIEIPAIYFQDQNNEQQLNNNQTVLFKNQKVIHNEAVEWSIQVNKRKESN
jgi:hypothetical protein